MRTLLIAVASVLLGGCASADTVSTTRDSPSVREYPTGSNIPRKNADPKAEGITARSRDDLERIQNSGYGVPPTGAGGSR